MRSNPAFLLVLFVGIAATTSLPGPAPGQERRSTALRERIKTRPDDPTLHYYLSIFEIAEGNESAGVATLGQVGRMGHGFLPPRGIGFDPVWDDSAFQRVRRELERKLPKVTAAREMFRLDRKLIPEGIAWDPRKRSWFVGSIAGAKIVRVDSTRAASDFSRPGELRPVLGLVVDAERRRLHAVSTGAITARPGEPVVNEVVSYDLDSGSRVRAVAVPAARQLNDVTVSPAGDLYATDTQGGAVYRIGGDGSVDTLVVPGTLPGANGLAIAAEGRVLYVAHSSGVARVRLEDGAVLGRIELPRGETIAAIDGLYADAATLIGIQNVTNPGRVIRLHLRADGDGVDRVETLLSHHHPAIDEPTTGVIVGRSFALLATTQVSRFTPNGTIDSPETLKPPVVLSVDLEAKGPGGGD
jgi:sugar lactone lactonase YvrE